VPPHTQLMQFGFCMVRRRSYCSKYYAVLFLTPLIFKQLKELHMKSDGWIWINFIIEVNQLAASGSKYMRMHVHSAHTSIGQKASTLKM
jgi:hypothetical protein